VCVALAANLAATRLDSRRRQRTPAERRSSPRTCLDVDRHAEGTFGCLSRSELAVARLVATGLTNREVASELFASVKTVEYHLRNSYIKLDITSRRALAALLV
jgi:DNA-binding NarL/FixJ family response regulator